MDAGRHEDHDRGLAFDLRRLSEQLARREALALLGAGGAALFAASAITAQAAGQARCAPAPRETKGPYPADGSGWSSGSVPNVLAIEGIVREDIRPSLSGSRTVADGVPLRLTLSLANSNAGCKPLAGAAVYLWQCDRDGGYSLYTVPEESYLRGVQVADSAGRVSFTTIFPACYPGRWPHLHFEVFPSLADATGGGRSSLISQLAFPRATCLDVYRNAAGYGASVANLERMSPATDYVLRDNSPEEIARVTPSFAGGLAEGYRATSVIGVPG